MFDRFKAGCAFVADKAIQGVRAVGRVVERCKVAIIGGGTVAVAVIAEKAYATASIWDYTAPPEMTPTAITDKAVAVMSPFWAAILTLSLILAGVGAIIGLVKIRGTRASKGR